MPEPQNFKNHAKFVPLYHGFAFPVAALNFVWTAKRAYENPTWDTGIAALFGAAVVVVFFFARIFALNVQDRVIRLEMRLRMREQLDGSRSWWRCASRAMRNCPGWRARSSTNGCWIERSSSR